MTKLARQEADFFIETKLGKGVTPFTWRKPGKFAPATLPFIIFILLILAQPCTAQQPQPAIWKVIIAEAVSEGYKGMYAVACVIRNRGGDLSGFCGSRRKDLEEFCQRQGDRYVDMAKDIDHKVFVEGAPDTTGGATHYEAIERYGIPYWVKGMERTVKIGEHTFYKEK